MKFLLFFLIATLGFSNLPPDALNRNEDFPIEEQLSTIQETISAIFRPQDEESCDNISVDSNNPYWDIVTVVGEREVGINIKEGVHGLILELPNNFIANENYSFIEEIKDTDIIDLELRTINNHQYLFLQHRPNSITRVYKDSLNPNIFYLAIAKTLNPYPYKVVIDPGHGGFDPGASYYGVHEKDIVLDIALRMEHKLKDLGIDVVYTRTTDEFVDLYERAYMSNTIDPDAFVSIHNNASTSKGPRGIGTFLYTPRGFQKEERIALATAIQDSLTDEFPDWKDWGLIWKNFCVTRETKNPSVLVEFGFLSNSKDRALLTEEEVRERAAKAIVNGIHTFIKK